MKRILSALFAILAATSCQERDTSAGDTMLLKGQIRGLKKGTVYLEKLEDSLIVLDSVELYGSGRFEFTREIEQPELMYIHLEKKDGSTYNDRFPFFAESGEITFSTSWDAFDRSGIIRGSSSDSIYREFRAMISKFNVRDLELGRAALTLDSTATDSLKALRRSNQVGRVRYTLNFAFTHPESAVSPYALLSEGGEANIVYLDSLWSVLGSEARESVYGRQLDEALKEFKARKTPQ